MERSVDHQNGWHGFTNEGGGVSITQDYGDGPQRIFLSLRETIDLRDFLTEAITELLES